MQVLFSFNQFVKLLFCIMHFCILRQTEKMATSFLAVEMKKRMLCEKKINDGVEASTRKSQACFHITCLMLGTASHESK